MQVESETLADPTAKLFASYPADCRPRHVEHLGAAGGFSGAQFWRLETPRGLLCARRWPTESPDSERLTFIHAVLEHVYRCGFTAIPLPIRKSDGQTFSMIRGRLWELTPWLPGKADYWPERKPEKLAAAMTALARWHLAADESHQSNCWPALSPGIFSRQVEFERLRDGGLHDLYLAVRRAKTTQPEWDELACIAERLSAAFARLGLLIQRQLRLACEIRVPLQPCIRDVRREHVLFDGDHVSGIVDFGAMRPDTVAGDVARLLDSLAGDDLAMWQSGLAAYQSVRPLSDDELTLVHVFDCSAPILSGLNWIDWIFRQERTFENPAEVVRRVKEIAGRVELLSAMNTLAFRVQRH